MKTVFLLLAAISTLLANIGEVTALSGEAQLIRQAEAIVVSTGTKINEADLLRTETRTKVQVVLKDDTVITIGPESEYLFERFKENGDAEVLMQLKRGFFKTVTGRIGEIAPQRFKIKTRAATIGIRGTQFMAYVQDDEEKIGCIQGEIIVWTAEGKYIVPAGEMLIYKEKRWFMKKMEMHDFAPVMIGMMLDAPQKKYTDLEMPELEDDYILEEQIIKGYQEPFSFDLGIDGTIQPPPYTPLDK
ncbi:MAG: FecR family protein [Campylobacterota bacterium]